MDSCPDQSSHAYSPLAKDNCPSSLVSAGAMISSSALSPSPSPVSNARSLLPQIPLEILVGEILATLELRDLGAMAQVCRLFAGLQQSEYLWQKKFSYDFPSIYTTWSTTMRQMGWRRIYDAMNRVEVYSWGNNTDCRLGYGRTPRKLYESVPKRIRRLDGVGVVCLAASGWGCHALDKQGNVWSWGRIMETNGIRSDAMPRMLKRPMDVVQLVAGRQVVLAKDRQGRVWQWCRENKVVEVTFGHLITHPCNNNNIGDSTRWDNRGSTKAKHGQPALSVGENDPVVDISAGWDICAALTRSGKIYTWRPPMTADGRYQLRVHVTDGVSLDSQGTIGYEAVTLDGDRFTRIAAGSDYVIAVTRKERVFIFRRRDSTHYHEYEEDPVQADRIIIEAAAENPSQERVVEIRGGILGKGLFLPIFSEALTHTITETYEEQEQIERRRRHNQHQHHLYRRHNRRHSSHHPCTTSLPATFPLSGNTMHDYSGFAKEESDKDGFNYGASRYPYPSPYQHLLQLRDHYDHYFTLDRHASPTAIPTLSSLPTFSYPISVSAGFKSFAIHHGSGKALLGKDDVQAETLPVVVERLHSNTCQVEFGDYHQGLLTEDGLLRTWGSFSDGALGHGDLRSRCPIPTVVEGPLRNKFVIQLGMAGSQSICLAIDLNDDKYQREREYSRQRHLGLSLDSKEGGQIDDGYYSLSGSDGSASHGSRSSSGGESSSGGDQSGHSGSSGNESLDSSSGSDDGEDWLLSGALSTSTSVFYSSSLRPAPMSAQLSYKNSSSRCCAACSLLANPNGHRQGGEGSLSGSRPSILRKRSHSMVEKLREAGGASNGSGHTINFNGRIFYFSKAPPIMTLTRLNPTLTAYEPVRDRETSTRRAGTDAAVVRQWL